MNTPEWHSNTVYAVCVIAGRLRNGRSFDSLNFNSLPSSALIQFAQHAVNVHFITSVWQIKICRFRWCLFLSLLFSLLCLAGRTNRNWREGERENIRAQQQEESAIVLHIRMQSKLVSRSNKRQELNSLPMLAAIVRNMCIRRFFFRVYQ